MKRFYLEHKDGSETVLDFDNIEECIAYVEDGWANTGQHVIVEEELVVSATKSYVVETDYPVEDGYDD
jgi:hypothetical protein